MGWQSVKPGATTINIIKLSDLKVTSLHLKGGIVPSTWHLKKSIKKRLEKNDLVEKVDFKVFGVPNDVLSATKLAEQAPFQFEVWAVSQLNATPTIKSGEKGVDGVITFIDHTRKDKVGKGIIAIWKVLPKQRYRRYRS